MTRSRLHKHQKMILSLKPRTWLSVIAIIIFFGIPVSLCYINGQYQKKLTALAQSASLTRVAYAAEEPVVKDPTNEQKEIIAYIKEVFGKDANKAFKLLKCENSSLNPRAVNTVGNTPEGSRDTGVFMINEYWQKVQYKFLLNYKVNIEIAHQLFSENGNSFKMWSCGQRLGI